MRGVRLWALVGLLVAGLVGVAAPPASAAGPPVWSASGPATVKSVYPIDIPRPRVASEIRYEQKFIDISRTIWDDLRAEVQRGASQEEARVAEATA